MGITRESQLQYAVKVSCVRRRHVAVVATAVDVVGFRIFLAVACRHANAYVAFYLVLCVVYHSASVWYVLCIIVVVRGMCCVSHVSCILVLVRGMCCVS